jgi:hypothetical protein
LRGNTGSGDAYEEKCVDLGDILSANKFSYNTKNSTNNDFPFLRTGQENWFANNTLTTFHLGWNLCDSSCKTCRERTDIDCLTCKYGPLEVLDVINSSGTCPEEGESDSLLSFRLSKKYPLDTVPNGIVSLILSFGTENAIRVDPSITFSEFRNSGRRIL